MTFLPEEHIAQVNEPAASNMPAEQARGTTCPQRSYKSGVKAMSNTQQETPSAKRAIEARQPAAHEAAPLNSDEKAEWQEFQDWAWKKKVNR
jgi:hypothetical protein